MRLGLLFLCLLYTSFSYGESATVLGLPTLPADCDAPFVYLYGEDGIDYQGATMTTDGTFLYVGGQKDGRALIVKMTFDGHVTWAQDFPALANPTEIMDLKVDRDGALIGVGNIRQGPDIETDAQAFAFKLDRDNGLLLWSKTYADPGSSFLLLYDILDNGTDYVLLGNAQNNTSQNTGCDAVFYTVNRNTGELSSVRRHFNLGSCETFTSGVLIDNNIYSTGRFNFANSGSNRMRPAVVSTDINGNPIWSRLYLQDLNRDARLYSNHIQRDGQDHLIVTAYGDEDGTDGFSNDAYLFRINLAGRAEWSRKLTYPEAVRSEEVVPLNDGYLLLSSTPISNRLFLTRINGAGVHLWTQAIDNIDITTRANEMIVVGSQIYLTAGVFEGGNSRLALFRINIDTGTLPNDCLSAVALDIPIDTDTSPYNGFNAITQYDVQTSADTDLTIDFTAVEDLPQSCLPDCEIVEICDNGIDDDGDDLIDCLDPDLTDDCCCYEPPLLSFEDSILVCDAMSLLLSVDTSFTSVQWSTGEMTDSITISTDGLITVTVTDRCGNDQIDSTFVRFGNTINTSESRMICFGETTSVFGEEIGSAGTYPATFPSQTGCDSTHTIEVFVFDSQSTSENRFLCPGETTQVFGQEVGAAGLYPQTFTDSNGCDSTHTIIVEILEAVTTEEERSICPGETTQVFGNDIGEAGNYPMTFVGNNGCDSTHTIIVEVSSIIETNEQRTLCQGDTIIVFGSPVTMADTLTQTYQGSNGCDSIHTVMVQQLMPVATMEQRLVCNGDSTTVFGEVVNASGSFNETYTASNGCDSIHTIMVNVLSLNVTTDTLAPLCAGSSIELFGEFISESGTYNGVFMDSNGCDSTHMVTVIFTPPVVTTDTLVVCAGETIDVFGTPTDTPGTYEQTFTSSSGCDSTHLITLVEETLSTSIIAFANCPEGPIGYIVLLRTYGNGGPYQVHWNGRTYPANTIQPVPPGTHIAQVTSANGCMYDVEFTVGAERPDWWWGLRSEPTCIDDKAGSIAIDTDFPGLSYRFNGEATSRNDSIIDGLGAGTYFIDIKVGDVCEFRDTIKLAEPTPPLVTLPDDQQIRPGESISIQPLEAEQAAATYTWSPGSTINCPNCYQVIATPPKTTTYLLQLTDDKGCSSSDEITIQVEEPLPYYIPNAFSPNRDGKNDYFTLYANEQVRSIHHMMIFTRWGEFVFERRDFSPNQEALGWDGYFRKVLAPQNTYVYYFEVELVTGERLTLKGDITLVR